MKNYKVYTFTLSPMTDEKAEILSAYLTDIGVDSFEYLDNGLIAYAEEGTIDEKAVYKTLKIMRRQGVKVRFSVSILDNHDWNATWEEEGFQPIVINDQCVIHKPNQSIPVEHPQYDIRINPRMSFGSGTHETTRMMIEKILEYDLSGMRCLDMGCGTGILSICMSMRGAREVVAIDIDDGCVENCLSNCQLNYIDNVDAIHGDASAISGEFDFIVANIHRNVIVRDMPTYFAHLSNQGHLIVSGFLVKDGNSILNEAKKHDVWLEHLRIKNDWVMLEFAPLSKKIDEKDKNKEEGEL